jgi:hypothetical protein
LQAAAIWLGVAGWPANRGSNGGWKGAAFPDGVEEDGAALESTTEELNRLPVVHTSGQLVVAVTVAVVVTVENIVTVGGMVLFANGVGAVPLVKEADIVDSGSPCDPLLPPPGIVKLNEPVSEEFEGTVTDVFEGGEADSV